MGCIRTDLCIRSHTLAVQPTSYNEKKRSTSTATYKNNRFFVLRSIFHVKVDFCLQHDVGRAADFWIDGFDGVDDGEPLFCAIKNSGLVDWDYEVSNGRYNLRCSNGSRLSEKGTAPTLKGEVVATSFGDFFHEKI